MVPGFISKSPRASPPQDNSEKPTRVRVRRTQLPRLDGGKGAKIQREGRLVKKFSRVQNSERIENGFEFTMQIARDIGGRLRPPAFLRETNPVLAGNDSAPCENLCKQLV